MFGCWGRKEEDVSCGWLEKAMELALCELW